MKKIIYLLTIICAVIFTACDVNEPTIEKDMSGLSFNFYVSNDTFYIVPSDTTLTYFFYFDDEDKVRSYGYEGILDGSEYLYNYGLMAHYSDFTLWYGYKGVLHAHRSFFEDREMYNIAFAAVYYEEGKPENALSWWYYWNETDGVVKTAKYVNTFGDMTD